jgi:hypothetical protein
MAACGQDEPGADGARRGCQAASVSALVNIHYMHAFADADAERPGRVGQPKHVRVRVDAEQAAVLDKRLRAIPADLDIAVAQVTRYSVSARKRPHKGHGRPGRGNHAPAELTSAMAQYRLIGHL